MLDAGRARSKLSQLIVRATRPGFTAEIEAGSSPSGPFTPVSDSQTVGGNTTFSLRGQSGRYYVVWITDLGAQHVGAC